MQLWREAMHSALYGPDGFYRRHEPAAHFRTSVTASPQFAVAMARLASAVDIALGRPVSFDLVDVGAGDGSFVTEVLAALPPDVAGRVRPVAVELRARPARLPDVVDWTSHVPESVTGLVMAHELLDNVTCDVLERVDGQVRQVTVDTDGREALGPPATAEQEQWLDRWWPVDQDGDRAECGIARDHLWGDLVGSLRHGLALAVDYGHLRDGRAHGAFAGGTLTGYRDGVQVVPVPDGRCDITAHVAIDACADAGIRAGAEHVRVVRQREALPALGVTAALPDLALAHSRPAEYVRQLSAASAAAELLDPTSLGGFWWLAQSKGMSVPPMGSDALSG